MVTGEHVAVVKSHLRVPTHGSPNVPLLAVTLHVVLLKQRVFTAEVEVPALHVLVEYDPHVPCVPLGLP